MAGKYGCMASFRKIGGVRRHLKSEHAGKSFPCPFAKENGCRSTYTTLDGAKIHAEAKHRQVRYPCPLANKENCTTTLASLASAKEHARAIHLGFRYPCPLAQEKNCQATFTTLTGANCHANSAHRQLQFPCPLAEAQRCDKLFKRPGDAQVHSKSHLGLRYPCPIAEDYGCKAMFKGTKRAKSHGACHTRPFLCPRQGCFSRFATLTDAFEHADDAKHPTKCFFLCPLPMCRNAVAGRRLTKSGLVEHKAAHIKYGDLSIGADYVPQKVEELRVHSSCALYSVILQHNGLCPIEVDEESGDHDLTEGQPDDTEDTYDLFAVCEEQEQEYSTLSLDGEGKLEESLGENGMLSKANRTRLLEQNTTLWNSHKDLKVSFLNLGLTCLGASRGFCHFVAEKCANEVVLDFDTARLVLVMDQSRMKLDNRCVACRAVIQLTAFLTNHDVELANGKEFCAFTGCGRPSFRVSGRCIEHLFDRKLYNFISKVHREKTITKTKLLREAFESAVRKRWSFSPDYDIVRNRTFDIQKGTRAGLDLVILDDEFSPASGQLWEFAMIEKVSGKTLVNTCVKHENGLDHRTWGEDPFLRSMSRSKAANVFSPSRLPKIDRLNADEVATKLQAAGITQDTIILVWHVGRSDLRILRRFLESAGHHGILPRDENCISLLQLFRTNLSVAPLGLKTFPLKLEILFPIFFPRHHLIGLNHRALEDCLQTRLLSLAFDELCKPVTQRRGKWRPENVGNIAQTTLLGWLQETEPLNSHQSKIDRLKR
ncbi:uncharacterized protein K441DRAFT_153431 [Cenococcum geophilum 1.58]|uniref:uncharacterized protein n=1 Tax=Cenococcum geophilum 1.58 TaxID=794803 RepID=UPI00358E1FD0|nr:hypothetical protein K441DRAFT_153431 [Cenococcum geophilum 1.58]